jgi:predicted HD phosphohydrolase
MNVADEILAVFGKRGAGAYFGERVSMTEHALQAAYLAQAAAAPPSLVVAALLHDVGHLVVPIPDDLADWLEDARHEVIGSEWLARRFPRRFSNRCGCMFPPSGTCVRRTRIILRN